MDVLFTPQRIDVCWSPFVIANEVKQSMDRHGLRPRDDGTGHTAMTVPETAMKVSETLRKR